MAQARTELQFEVSFASIIYLLFLWVSGVEIEVNTNSTPNWVGVGAGAELGKKDTTKLG